MSIEHEIQELDGVRRQVRVRVDETETRKAFDKATRAVARQARLPGFRPGKAPLDMIRGRFRDTIRQEVLEDLVPKTLRQALRNAEVDPLHIGEVSEVDLDEGGPLAFTAEVEVAPGVELGSYQGIEVKRPSPEVTDEEIERRLQSMREAQGVLEPVERAEVQEGDFVLCDVIQAPGEEGGEPRLDEDVFLRAGDERNFDDLNEALGRGRVGETVEFESTYSKDHPDPGLAGKSFSYRLRVKSLKQQVLPELDDAFAREHGDAEDLEDLRRKTREGLTEAKRAWSEQVARERLLDNLLREHDFLAPPSLVQDHARASMRERIQEMEAQGMDPRRSDVDWDREFKMALGMSERHIRAHFLLKKIAEQEGIEVTDDDLEDRLKEIADARSVPVARVRAQAEREKSLEPLRDSILRRRVLDFLLEGANILDEED